MVEREGIVIYFNNNSAYKTLKDLVHIYYYSKRFNYALVYYNKKNKDKILKSLQNNNGISHIEESDFDYSLYSFKE